MIDLYTAGTPNGWKASIMLEECGLPYEPHFLSLGDQDQKRPDFLKINPNGRIPAIVDRDAGDFPVFESGAILLYLAEKSGKLLPNDPKARSRTIQWLFWQNAGLGPMMGQLNVFRRYFPEHLPAAIERYERESYRLFGVLEGQLKAHQYVAGDDYTLADISCWPWIRGHFWADLSLDAYPALKAWHDLIAERPAVQRGLQVPPPRDSDADREKSIATAQQILV
jgi:GSH-dependent disulfide-bond oxidoreductase